MAQGKSRREKGEGREASSEGASEMTDERTGRLMVAGIPRGFFESTQQAFYRRESWGHNDDEMTNNWKGLEGARQHVPVTEGVRNGGGCGQRLSVIISCRLM
jgi:hypothetical protein